MCQAAGCAEAFTAHLLAWRYGTVAAVVDGYRLLAERERRKTLLLLVSSASHETVIFVDKGPGDPALWVRVGDTRSMGESRGQRLRHATARGGAWTMNTCKCPQRRNG